jgi:tetratricopeptide (TPR) repeat protein
MLRFVSWLPWPAAVLVIGIFLGLHSIAAASSGQAGDRGLEAGLGMLEEGRTLLDDAVLAQARNYFLKLTTQQGDNAVYFYELARVHAYRSESCFARGDKKAAGRALDEGIASVEQSLRLNERSADAQSLLADLYGRIGFGTAMLEGPKYGPKVKDENKRALEIDGRNPRVLASLGRQYLQAPKMFGGNLDQALESFRKSIELDPAFDETYVWLAIALRKKGDLPGADQALETALRLNPRSAFAKHTEAKK